MQSWLDILEQIGDTPENRNAALNACLEKCDETNEALFEIENLKLLAHIKKSDPPLWLSRIAPILHYWPKEDRTLFHQLLNESTPESKEKGKKELPTISYGDVFNGECLANRHGNVLRYCKEWASWHIWVGTHWQKDRVNEVYDFAKETLTQLFPVAIENEDEKLFKHIVRSRSHRGIVNMLDQAGATEKVRVRPEQYDRYPWLLNCPNGTVNLKTGEILEHDPSLLITKCTSAQYNPEAECPKWLEFLSQIMIADPITEDDSVADIERKEEVINYLQRCVGYSLVGEVHEKILLLPWGEGNNGKSTFIETIAAVLGGDYAMRTHSELFLSRKEGTISNDIAALTGVRFAYATEPPLNRPLNASLIKELTGGDTVSARFMRGEYFSFRPECTLWMSANHKPHTYDTGNALWDRLKLIPFTISIQKEKQNKNLKNELMTEAEGILAWAIQGCLDWQRQGLNEPGAVMLATGEYRQENDTVAGFIEEVCDVLPGARVKSGQLYERYKKYCDQTGEREISGKAFSAALEKKGYLKKKENTGMWFHGIGLRQAEREDEPPPWER